MSKPRMRVQANMEKATSYGVPVSRLRLGELSYSGLRSIEDYIDDVSKKELRWPNLLKTYSAMQYDEDVSLGLHLTNIMVENAFSNFQVDFNPQNENSREVAKFVKWSLNSMTRPLVACIRDALTCQMYGFSVLVKNYEDIKFGKYAGKYKYKIKDLSPRHQKTIDPSKPFILNGNGEVVAVRQTTKTLTSTNSAYLQPVVDQFSGKSYIDIPINKCMLFSFNSTNGNPLGESVLKPCFKAWGEKTLISEYEVTGVVKDMGK